MRKIYTNQNVYEAAQDRIKLIFDKFDNVLVAFSGGKDSGMCLNLCYDYAVRNGCTEKLALYHMDYEAQYQATVKYVTETFSAFPHIKRKFWLCVPMTVPCQVSAYQSFWTPWNEAERDIWVRDMPTSPHLVTRDKLGFTYADGTSDYTLQDMFGKWFADTYGKTAVVIGIRTDESYDRYRILSGDGRKNIPYGQRYLTGDENLSLAYPIYDWAVEDIFTAYGKFGYAYNPLYDLMYQSGVPIRSMRVASPFIGQAVSSLQLYRVIEPQTWAKLLGRVNGVNFAGIYGNTTAMGWQSITLPKGHTWKSYLQFLLSTLPDEQRKLYEKKFQVSEQFWKNRGGCLDEQTVHELQQNGVKINVHDTTNYRTTKKPVTFDEYPDDANVTDFKSVPSYKRMCVCVMKNDFLCKYMGFSLTKEEMTRRTETMNKYKQYYRDFMTGGAK